MIIIAPSKTYLLLFFILKVFLVSSLMEPLPFIVKDLGMGCFLGGRGGGSNFISYLNSQLENFVEETGQENLSPSYR